MKIAVIGASGKAGRLIAEEAYIRGHEVTAVVRNPDKVDTDKYGLIVKDLFDLQVEDLEDFDIVVSAYGAPIGKEDEYVTSMQKFISIMESLPEVRFFVVGGAGSLYTDDTKTKLAYTLIPEQFAAVPIAMLKAFEELKKSKVNWTFQSPAFTFDANGPRTGKYTLGTDFLINNRQGKSYISYADFAVAMVDEMERGKFIGKRFTAVSDSE
ncbi:MAG: NAD(P)H-binding protein [Clostridiales bacterium]|jgi:putative NADH-flavin reductase|nr:NAD(P)H-binding protein [Clostridiales bacterium]